MLARAGAAAPTRVAAAVAILARMVSRPLSVSATALGIVAAAGEDATGGFALVTGGPPLLTASVRHAVGSTPSNGRASVAMRVVEKSDAHRDVRVIVWTDIYSSSGDD